MEFKVQTNDIFIGGNIPSSKNSKNIITLKNGRKMLRNSKQLTNT